MTPKARMILIGVIVPILIAAAGVIAVLVFLPQLPDPVATHWGGAGEPDEFGSPLMGILIAPLIVLGFSVLAVVVSRPGPVSASVNQRIILAVAPAFAVFINIAVVGSTLMQVGLSDARDAGSIFPFLGLGVVAAAAVGVAAWFLLPKSSAVAAETGEPDTLPLGKDERATWVQRARPSRVIGLIVAGILLLTIVSAGLALWSSGDTVTAIVLTAILVVVAIFTVGILWWRVTIDRNGLRARSIIGFPRFIVPLSEVESATVIDVEPARDFGGWGLRWGGGRRWGIVTRSGEALEVKRRNRSALVVTVADAATGAALLNTLARRVH